MTSGLADVSGSNRIRDDTCFVRLCKAASDWVAADTYRLIY